MSEIDGGEINCAELFERDKARELKNKYVPAVADKSPNCACEQVSVGEGENPPGKVGDDEMLAACAFSPEQCDEQGNLTYKFVSKAFRVGMSVTRMGNGLGSASAMDKLCVKLEKGDPNLPPRKSQGWVQARAGDIRQLKDPADPAKRMFCIYDTSRAKDRAHADIMATNHFRESGRGRSQHLQASRDLIKLFRRPD